MSGAFTTEARHRNPTDDNGVGPAPPLESAAVIECLRVKRRFGRVQALDGVDATIPDRACYALVGPNGAGKTTLLRMLAGVLPLGREDGRLLLDGAPRHQWQTGACAFVPEGAPAPADLLVGEYLHSSAVIAGVPDAQLPSAIDRAVDACQLHDVRGRLVSVLSRGYRQRVALAAAMVGSPQLIVLDEPTSGLDPGQLMVFRSLVDSLRERSTVVLSSHHLGEVASCASHVLVLAGGRVRFEGTLDALRALGHGSLEDAYAHLLSQEQVPS